MDIVVTNLSKWYESPEPLPPLLPDNPAIGEPSDHLGVIVYPVKNVHNTVRTKTYKTVRQFPESKTGTFGQIICNQSWSFLASNLGSSQLVELFEYYVQSVTDAVFPVKQIYVSSDDKPYFTEELRKMKR